MKVHGDIERINLATGERFRRVVGDGESRLEGDQSRCYGRDFEFGLADLNRRVSELERLLAGIRRLGPQAETEEEVLEKERRVDEIVEAAREKLK